VFAREIAAELTKTGKSCELVPEYASHYIQQAGDPASPWEQLVIGMGQFQAEQHTERDYVVTDAAAFATYVYAERAIPHQSEDDSWPKHRQLLDVLRIMARDSVNSYDLIFLLTHVYPPRKDGVKREDHLSLDECQTIGRNMATYLDSERVDYHRVQTNNAKAVPAALHLIEQRSVIEVGI